MTRRANPPRPAKARGLCGPKIFRGLNMSTQPVIFGEFGGPTRRVEPVLPSLLYPHNVFQYYITIICTNTLELLWAERDIPSMFSGNNGERAKRLSLLLSWKRRCVYMNELHTTGLRKERYGYSCVFY